MTFVPGDKYLATVDGSVLSIWDVETGRVVRTISTDGTAHGDGFGSEFVFTADGKRVLSADGRKSRLILWEYSSGKLLKQSPELDGIIECIAIRPDGRMAACATHFGDVFLWEVDKKVVRCVVERYREIRSLTFAAEEKHLVVLPSEGGVAKRIDVASGKVLKQIDLGSCGRVALAPSDGTIATYSYPDQLYLYDTRTGQKRRLPLKEKVGFLDLSFSPDGRTLLAMDRRAEMVQFWDVAKGQLLRRLRVPDLADSHEHAQLLLSGDGKRLASHEEYRVVRIWDAGTGQPCLRMPGHFYPPGQLAFSTDGKEVVSLGGGLFRWDATTGKLLTRVSPDAPKDRWPTWKQEWGLAPGGRHLAERVRISTYVYDGKTGKRLLVTDKTLLDSDWTFTPDGQALITIGAEQDVCLWCATTGKLLRRLDLDKKAGPISWLRITPDGKTLVTGESWKKIHLWDAATGKHRTTLTLPAKREPFQKPLDRWEIAISPDSRHLFTSNTENHMGLGSRCSQGDWAV